MQIPQSLKLPDKLDQSLTKLKNNIVMNKAFGYQVIISYIKLRNYEIKEFRK